MARETTLYRNGSGYIDPTACQALKKVEKEEKKMSMNIEICPGDIWESAPANPGDPLRTFLVIAVHGGICNVLKLQNQIDMHATKGITVYARTPKCTHVGMLSYVSRNRLSEYIKTLPEKEFQEVKNHILEGLGLEADQKAGKELESAHSDIVNALTESVNSLEGKLEAAEKTRDELLEEIRQLKTKTPDPACCTAKSSSMKEIYIIGTVPVPEWCRCRLMPYQRMDGCVGWEFFGNGQSYEMQAGEKLKLGERGNIYVIRKHR